MVLITVADDDRRSRSQITTRPATPLCRRCCGRMATRSGPAGNRPGRQSAGPVGTWRAASGTAELLAFVLRRLIRPGPAVPPKPSRRWRLGSGPGFCQFKTPRRTADGDPVSDTNPSGRHGRRGRIRIRVTHPVPRRLGFGSRRTRDSDPGAQGANGCCCCLPTKDDHGLRSRDFVWAVGGRAAVSRRFQRTLRGFLIFQNNRLTASMRA